MNTPLEILLSVFLVGTAVMIVATRNLLAVIVLLSLFSAVMSVIFAALGATDVAFTEAVVGAGVSTALLMALPRRVGALRWPAVADGHVRRRPVWPAAFVAGAVGAVMVHAMHWMPPFGDPSAPAHLHVSAYYTAHARTDMNTPNFVTAILGDYRSFDTLIETAVVVTGAVACLLVLRGKSLSRHEAVADE